MLKMNFKIRVLIFTIFLFAKGSYSAQKKNIVLIVADDLGWNDVSFHGSNQFLTPNIDTLAYSGIVLNNYYVLPVCSPSRSALMTGVHPIHTGMHHSVIHNGEPFGLPLTYKILPQYLKEYGYTTRAVGKWHLGFHKRIFTPVYRGFDSHFGYWGSKEDYFTHEQYDVKSFKGLDLRRNMKTCRNYTGQYATDLFTEESVNIINSHNVSEPLFLYLAHLASHSGNSRDPLQAPAKVIEMFNYIKDEKRRKLAAMVWKLDESVGRVVQALASKNMLNDTIIIFTSDNGGPVVGMAGNHASNWPLRGAKATLWEGGVRGTSFIWSADLPHSKVSNALMHIQDWLPTILAAVGNDVTDNSTFSQGLDGHNMWPVLTGVKDFEYDELIIQQDQIAKISALRKNNWKIIKGTKVLPFWYGPSGRDTYYSYNVTRIQQSPAAIAISSNNLTIPTEETILQVRANVSLSCDYCGENESDCTACVISKNGICVFDLSTDPCERNDLADKYPSITTGLMKIMKKYVPDRPLNKHLDIRANPMFWNRTWINWMDYVGDARLHAGVKLVATD